MRYVIRLSQEHDSLPRAELEAVLTAEDVEYTVTESYGPVLIVAADALRGIDRLALTFEAGEHVHTCAVDELSSLQEIAVPVQGAFAVRKHVVDDTAVPADLTARIGSIIDAATDHPVELDEPAEEFRAYVCDGQLILSRITHVVDRSQYEARKSQHLPFSKPITLHPRIARTLVNLAGVTQRSTVLDPFCGTGALLLEAGLIGCTIAGLDVQSEMVDGTEQNLAAFDLDGDIRDGDVAQLSAVFDTSFDAVVTDLPYGKGSKVAGDAVQAFLDQAPQLAGTLVFMSNQPELGPYTHDFELYVHRSLTRYVYVV